MPKKFYKYSGVLAAGIALFFACAASNGLFKETEMPLIIRRLTDCFTVAGVVLAGVGGLSWASSKGAYDTLRYGVDWVIKPFTPRRFEYESLYDFKQRIEKARKPWLKECLAVGAGFLAVALILTAVFLLIE